MPGMSGPEFCQKVRETHPNGNIYLILLTSKTDKADVSTGLRAGADEFLSKPLHKEELQARMLAGLRIVELQQNLIAQNAELDRAHKSLTDTHARLEDDLRAAAKLQQVYIPPEFHQFENWAISTVYKPCTYIGGDLVGYFPISDDEIGIYSIDVAGHGVSAALKTVTLAQSLNPYDKKANLAFEVIPGGEIRTREPHELMSELNARHQDDSETDQYFTMAYAIINRKTCTARMCQAGHPNPLVLRHNGEAEFIGDGGAPVGLFPFVEYDTIEFPLFPRDRLFLFSDGVTECEKPDGTLWDEEGLSELFSGKTEVNLERFSSYLIDKLSSVHGASEFTDDISGVLIDPWPEQNNHGKLAA
jgi:sigma-B regulation protein RsbU (phosphoserine phosphatase)